MHRSQHRQTDGKGAVTGSQKVVLEVLVSPNALDQIDVPDSIWPGHSLGDLDEDRRIRLVRECFTISFDIR
jgi:hypothetical protein